jgi:hypothetical protein
VELDGRGLPARPGTASLGLVQRQSIRKLLLSFGALAHAAYLSDPLKARIGIWPTVAVIVGPILLLHVFRRSRADEISRRMDLLGGAWYLVLTAASVDLAVRGYRPPGWNLFLAAMVPGALYSVGLIARRLRKRELSTELSTVDTTPHYPSNKPIE